MKRTVLSLCFCLTGFSLFAQFARWDDQALTLDNGKVKRIIQLGDTIQTIQFLLTGCPDNFVAEQGSGSSEFSLLIDNKSYTGSGGWKVINIIPAADPFGGQGAVLVLKGKSGLISQVELRVTYLLYPDLPVIRKKIGLTNAGPSEIKIESLDVESLDIAWWETHNVVMADYGRQKRLGPYLGDSHDPVLAAHDASGRRGLIIGNEAPGVVKRTSVLLNGITIEAGLTHTDQLYGFRRWLSPGEAWESPCVFIALYHNTDNPYDAINGPVNDFVRDHMGTRISMIREKPVFVYDTWNPFRDDINDAMIREIAKAASECGVEEFIIDAGWYKNASDWEDSTDNWFNECGDWLIDEKKFPRGLKPVFDYIKSLGMKPGLWVSLGTASLHSEVYREHPEYWTRDSLGNSMFLHVESDKDNASGCFSSDWPKYIKKVILDLVKDHGLAYAKLDLAVVTSPYTYNKDRAGCYATNHKHKDREESFLMNYEELFKTFDELHAEAPDLFIDCTFETMGALQLIDYAMCQHAEGNWLSNFEESSPTGNLRVRNMAWWRSPAIPASSLVIGNPRMDDPDPYVYFKSLAGTLPIMLGDPRKLTPEERAGYKQLADWLRAMQEKHNYAVFRQDLPGFGEPMQGQWDGFQRINTLTKSGGIVGVFRHGSHENTRMVTVSGLDPDNKYTVRKCSSPGNILCVSGAELMETGFEVSFTKLYDGELFEICTED